MAIPAVLFELGMPFDKFAWHNKLFEDVLRASGPNGGAND
jgi:hypothetical protein